MYQDDDLIVELDDDCGAPTPAIAPIASLGPMPTLPTTSYRRALVDNAGIFFDFSDTKLTPIQQVYLLALASRGTRKGACECAGVSIRTVDNWSKDPEFLAALKHAGEVVMDALEEELIDRAMNGSDKLLIEAMKAHKPEKYNKKQADVNLKATMVHSWAELAQEASKTPTNIVDVGDE